MVLRALACAFAFAVFPLASTAQGTSVGFGSKGQDPSAPVEVTADSLKVDQDAGTATYSGNVVIIQGEMRLAAPLVIVVLNESKNAIDHLEATGGVTLVSGEDAAEAESAEYFIDTGNITMRGNVLLSQGANAASSEEMIVNLETGQATLTGRVKTILQPAEK